MELKRHIGWLPAEFRSGGRPVDLNQLCHVTGIVRVSTNDEKVEVLYNILFNHHDKPVPDQ